MSPTVLSPPVATAVRVLVIEPDARAAATLSNTVSAMGFAAETVATAAAALHSVTQEQPFTLIFVSESLADMDAFDCFARLKRLAPRFTGVLLSSTTDVATVFAAISAGFQTVLAKPIDAVDVLPLLG